MQGSFTARLKLFLILGISISDAIDPSKTTISFRTVNRLWRHKQPLQFEMKLIPRKEKNSDFGDAKCYSGQFRLSTDVVHSLENRMQEFTFYYKRYRWWLPKKLNMGNSFEIRTSRGTGAYDDEPVNDEKDWKKLVQKRLKTSNLPSPYETIIAFTKKYKHHELYIWVLKIQGLEEEMKRHQHSVGLTRGFTQAENKKKDPIAVLWTDIRANPNWDLNDIKDRADRLGLSEIPENIMMSLEFYSMCLERKGLKQNINTNGEKVEKLLDNAKTCDEYQDLIEHFLNIAVEDGKFPLVKFLMARGADPSMNNCKVLTIAAEKRHLTLIHLMLEYGIKLDECSGNDRFHLVHYVLEQGGEPLFKKMIAHGLKLKDLGWNCGLKYGFAAALCFYQGTANELKIVLQAAKEQDVDLANQPSIGYDGSEHPVLVDTIFLGRPDLAEVLISEGASRKFSKWKTGGSFAAWFKTRYMKKYESLKTPKED